MSAMDDFEPLRADNLSAFDAAPQVASPAKAWVLPVGVAAAAGLGLLVFAGLNANRLSSERAHAAARAPQADHERSPRAAVVSAPIASLPAASLGVALQTEPPGAAEARLHAPTLVVDLGSPDSEGAPRGANAQSLSSGPNGDGLSDDERFVARFGAASSAAHARLAGDPAATISQGTIIAGVLETAINSDLPGYVRALVSRDVASFDGAHTLIPRGSRLIGQYRAGVGLGQSRAFVIWTRLIRPDGVTIDLNSPGADELGQAGLEGRTDRHFLNRFGGAILLTLIGAASDAAVDGNRTQVVVGVARDSSDAASTALNEEIKISPTIRVAQGTPIRIFASRDLDFSTVATAP